MDSDKHRAKQLFDNRKECCLQHNCDGDTVNNPSYIEDDTDATQAPRVVDTITFADEDFERGFDELPWKNEGFADWTVESSPFVKSGKKSLVSGDLGENRGKSSSLSIKVDSSSGATVTFYYKALVSEPFDHFVVKIDGNINHMDKRPSGPNWMKFSRGVSPGEHTLSFHVESPTEVVTIDREVDPDGFGSGRVYIDDFSFTPS